MKFSASDEKNQIFFEMLLRVTDSHYTQSLIILIFWGKVQNCSISHRFRDKCVFAFYTENQDDRQKWQENDFWEKSLVNS